MGMGGASAGAGWGENNYWGGSTQINNHYFVFTIYQSSAQ